MKPVVLFRKDYSTEDEFEKAKQHFDVKELRSKIEPNSLVIGRYSTLPFYYELEKDLAANGSRLINSHNQYQWIANFDWYEQLKEFTFETWFRAQDVPDGIPLVVKGRTNSRKHEWNRKMFAENKQQAIEIMIELQTDGLIGPQGIVFRRYEPLVTYEIGNNGLRFTEEYRCFFYKTTLIDHGYYWTMARNVLRRLPPAGLQFVLDVARIAAEYTNFYVLDIALKENGEWVLVEVNDAQMAGLSEIDPSVLYNNLSMELIVDLERIGTS